MADYESVHVRAKPVSSAYLAMTWFAVLLVIIGAISAWRGHPLWEGVAAMCVFALLLGILMSGTSLELRHGRLVYRHSFIRVFDVSLGSITNVRVVYTLKEAIATASLPGRMHLKHKCAGGDKSREVIIKPFAIDDVRAIETAIKDAISRRT